MVSDHFEELGRPPSLMHGGFGLRSVGELRKPRWWALALLERLRDSRLAVQASGDGGGSLVEAIATRDETAGALAALVWNFTLDQTKVGGDSRLEREVTLTWAGLTPAATYVVQHHRVDTDHSNLPGVWESMRADGQDWPDEDQWPRLAEADRLDELLPDERVVVAEDGTICLDFTLPMPAMSLVELVPA